MDADDLLLADDPDDGLLSDIPIESRIGIHDSDHFEVKLDYHVDLRAKTEYRVESYLFVPRSLGINEQTYPADHFYADVQGYIRFKTPSLTLRGLTERTPESPLEIIRARIAELHGSPGANRLRQQLGYELRMFGCVARAHLRDQTAAILGVLSRLDESGDPALFRDAQSQLATLLEDSLSVVREWRSLRGEFAAPATPRSARETFQYVDEYLSLVLEVKFTSLLKKIDELSQYDDGFRAYRDESRELLLNERSYRDESGYPYTLTDQDNEVYVFRHGMLKKFVMSVLWLEIAKEKEGKRLSQIGAGVAAGTAMLFAVLITILNMQWFVINTAGFAFAAVVTYIMKDRLKDLLKGYFQSKMTRWLSDYASKICDPISGAIIGQSREAFSYVTDKTIPPEVWRCRHQEAYVSIEALAKPEVVMKYTKAIKLNGKELRDRLHLENYDLNDIMRFSLSNAQRRADDPRTAVPVFDAEQDKVVRRKFRKVYHLNIVMLFHTDVEKPIMKKLRVVFDKKTIRRIEEIPVR